MNEHDDRARHAYRAQARTARRTLSDEQRADAADALVGMLQRLAEYASARRIGCYSAVASELSLAPLIAAELAHGRQVYLPHVEHTSPQMHFAPWHGNRKLLMPNRFGILEPLVDAAQLIDAPELDLLLLPLVAFDRRGYRLGSGAGYYDRALSFRLTQPAPPFLIGVGFACQECPPIPTAEWDVPLDAIATECEIIRPSSS